jgi:putative FmdB family regulatory protein
VPIYEYECTRCHHRFEKLQRLSDAPVEECPACGGAVSQMVSAPSIQFKGSGFYVNDYAHKPAGAKSGTDDKAKGDKADAHKSGEKSAEKSGEASTGSTEKSETKTESKPEAKAPAAETKST